MSNRKGFTLIELLIVVVIIGILAAIAIPKFASTKQKAYVAAMKSDLKNLITAEESYFADKTTYTTNLGTAFSPTTGVTVTINAADGAGWKASATHTGVPGKTCTIYAVTSQVITGQSEGAPTCA